MEQIKWKKFEELVASVQKRLSPTSQVEHNINLPGIDSGIPRQMDVLVKTKVGQMDLVIAIDCKDTKDPVDIKDVEAFAGEAKDVRANQAVLVGANGFTTGAKQLSERLGIKLYTLVDTSDHEWQAQISIPAICHETYLDRFAFQLSATGYIGYDPEELIEKKLFLYDEQGKPLGLFIDLLYTLWNERKLPTEPGEYVVDVVPGISQKMWEGELRKFRAQAKIVVTKRTFFGWWELKEISGFKDELTNVITTSKLATKTITYRDVHDHWKIVNDESEIAIEPAAVLESFVKYPIDRLI